MGSISLRRIDSDRRYWTTNIHLGFGVLGTVAAGVFVYLLASPKNPHRSSLEAIAGAMVLAAITLAPLGGRIARRSWRSNFVLGATLVTGAVLAVCCHLDSGLDSPLIVFLALPAVNAALSLPVRAVLLSAMAAVVELVAIAATDPNVASSTSHLVILATFFAGMLTVALGWASSRTRLQHDEAALFTDVIRLAQTDTLTGCLNHGYFFERLENEIDRAVRHGQPLSLLIVDVDLFKAFNDTYGHAEGDAALVIAGSVMTSSIRSFDSVGRIGGDEFAIILPATSFAAAQRLADRMCEALDQPRGMAVTVSIGIATLERSEPTANRLFRDADAGLYVAKANGRARSGSHVDASKAAQSSGQDSQREPQMRDGGEAGSKRLEEGAPDSYISKVEALAILDTLETSASVGLGYIDSHFRILRLNAALAAVNGGRVEDQLGRLVADVVPDHWPALEPAYRSVLETSQPLLNQEVAREFVADSGQPRYWLTNFYPVRLHGDTTGICVVAIDITMRKEAELAQAALSHTVEASGNAAVETRDPKGL